MGSGRGNRTGTTVTIDYTDGMELPTVSTDIATPVPPADAVLNDANQLGIVEAGTHDELMAVGGVYRELNENG